MRSPRTTQALLMAGALAFAATSLAIERGWPLICAFALAVASTQVGLLPLPHLRLGRFFICSFAVFTVAALLDPTTARIVLALIGIAFVASAVYGTALTRRTNA